MDTTPADAGAASDFELPAPLTFQRIFQSCPYWGGASPGLIPRVVKRLRKNARKHSFLLDTDERQLVLSVTTGQPSFFQIHDHPFAPFMEHAAAVGVGPKLVFNSPDQGYVVSEYLEGRCWRSEDFRVMGNIERLSQLLKTVHGLPKTVPQTRVSETVNYYWRMMQNEYAKLPSCQGGWRFCNRVWPELLIMRRYTSMTRWFAITIF